MEKNRLEGQLRQFRGKVKQEWNELTDDEIDAAEGRTEQLAGKIQERYGVAKEKAEERLNEIKSDCKS